MINSKLIRILNSFSKKDMQQLKAFISSPFFNTNPTIILLFEFIFKAYPHFDKRDISKESAYKNIYPKKTFNDSSFRNLILAFTKLVVEFLKHKELKTRPALENQLLLNSLSKRLLNRDFNDLYLKTQQEYKSNPPKDSEQFLEQYLSLKTFYHNPETNRTKIDQNHSSQILNSLNQFFALSKLKHAIEIASRKDLLKEEIPKFFFKKHLSKYATTLPKEQQTLFNVLIMLDKFYQIPTKNHLQKTLKIFKVHHANFSQFDKKMILTVFINQMNHLFRLGHTEYLRKIYNLYIFGLKEDILLHNNTITTSDFLNIVTTASRNKKINWAIEFIQNYNGYLLNNDKEQTIALATATVEYDKGMYHKVTEILAPFSFRKSPLGLRFRFITAKAYVELAFQKTENLKLTQTFILRMEQYLKRNTGKNQTDQSIGFSNFLKIIKALLKECINNNNPNLEKLKSLIDKSTPIIAKNWLLQKVNDLE